MFATGAIGNLLAPIFPVRGFAPECGGGTVRGGGFVGGGGAFFFSFLEGAIGFSSEGLHRKMASAPQQTDRAWQGARAGQWTERMHQF